MASRTTFMTQADLATRWQISEWTIWAMRRRGELPPALRVGRSLRWRTAVIEEWEAKNTRAAAEFDPVFCERAARAVAARGQKPVNREKQATKRGRPTKGAMIEQRRTAGGAE